MDAKYDRKIEFQKINISTFPKYQGSCLFLISSVSSGLFFLSLPQTNIDSSIQTELHRRVKVIRIHGNCYDGFYAVSIFVKIP